MSLNSAAHFWDTVKAFPCPIILCNSETQSLSLNMPAQKLLGINEQHHLCRNAFSNVTFINPLSKISVSIDELFSTYITPNSSARVIVEVDNEQYLQKIKLVRFSKTLSLVSLEAVERDESTDSNFDKIISEISTDLIDIQNDKVDQYIEHALCAIGTVCNADRAYIFTFNDENTTISNTHEWVNKGIKPFKERLQNLPKSELPYFFSLMNTAHLFKTNDVNDLPEQARAEKREFKLQKIKSVLCIGLRFDNKLIGFIGCDCVEQKRRWSERDLIRLKLVGEIIANALKNLSYKAELQSIQLQLITANQKLNELVNTDSLTNIANRRCFDLTLECEIKRCARSNQPLSLIICDIDFFKNYNDSYGHQQGDEALIKVANALQSQCRRQGDLAARYGGEEFAIILPSTNAKHCHQFTALIQQAIKDAAITHKSSSIEKLLTLSIGYYCITPDKNTTPQCFINRADKALYQAKETGRNKVCQYKAS